MTTDLEKLKATFDEVGIEYVVRHDNCWSYLFFGECRNICNLELSFETSALDRLLAHKFIEFEDGKLCGQFNS